MWSSGELAIGVVGVAPWATLEFCRALYGLVEASKDWHYPRLLIDANSKIPSRGRHLELGERDPSPFIRQTIAELAQSGAGVVVVPCNTAHILYARWSEAAPVAVPNILEVSIDRVAALGARSVAVLESGTLRTSRAYPDLARARGLRTVALTDAEAEVVRDLITAIKLRGQPSDDENRAFRALGEALIERGAEALLLGCTELRAFMPVAPRDCPLVDSNEELARAAARLAGCPMRAGA